MSEGTSDLFDKYREQARIALPLFRDFGGRRRFKGVVSTVRCYEDNSKVREVANSPGKGRVLVVDGGGSQRCALMGDVVAGEAVANQWEGVVIFGCVRDVEALAKLDIGIKAMAATPRGPHKLGAGYVDVPIEIAGLVCAPGDILFADADGILLLDAKLLGERTGR